LTRASLWTKKEEEEETVVLEYPEAGADLIAEIILGLFSNSQQ
jgi:hypothetical protein